MQRQMRLDTKKLHPVCFLACAVHRYSFMLSLDNSRRNVGGAGGGFQMSFCPGRPPPPEILCGSYCIPHLEDRENKNPRLFVQLKKTVPSVRVCVCVSPASVTRSVYQLQSVLSSVRTLRPKLAFQGLTKLFMLTRRRPCLRSECPATRYSTPEKNETKGQGQFAHIQHGVKLFYFIQFSVNLVRLTWVEDGASAAPRGPGLGVKGDSPSLDLQLGVLAEHLLNFDLHLGVGTLIVGRQHPHLQH